MKRPRSDSEASDSTIQDDVAVARGKGESLDELSALEVLRGLRAGSWDSPTPSGTRDDEDDQDSGTEWTRPTTVRSIQPKNHKTNRAAFSSGTTRSYVWRGPSRRLSAHKQADDLEQLKRTASTKHAGACSGSSSEVEEEEESHSGHKQKDKDWAALTTWLRMNLHHPRTTKKLVLFVGTQQSNRSWRFELNPGLAWDDVSPETKLRLKTLTSETCAAFQRKYPSRPVGEWVKKTQKYKVPGSGEVVSVPLSDMIYSLRDVYQQYEAAEDSEELSAEHCQEQQVVASDVSGSTEQVLA